MFQPDRAASYSGKTVCVCAPTWASRESQQVIAALTQAGAITIAPVVPSVRDQALRERLEMAEAMLVINAGGYVSDANAHEIALALRLGVHIDFIEPVNPLNLDPAAASALAHRRAQLVAGPTGSQIPELPPGVLLTVADPGDHDQEMLFRLHESIPFGDRDAALKGTPLDHRSADTVIVDGAPRETATAGYTALRLEYLGTRSQWRELSRTYRRALPRTVPGAAVLIRDIAGRVLLVKPAYGDDHWHLPGGGLDPHEHPRDAARREAIEELGLAWFEPGELLVVDQAPARKDAQASTEYVFDGGELSDAQIAQIHLPAEELADVALVAPSELEERATPRLARRITAALERRSDPGAPVMLDHGYRAGLRPQWSWHQPDALPAALPIRQVGVWAFDQDGRVLVQHRVQRHTYGLPAGRPEPGEEPIETAVREAMEESQIDFDTATAVLFGAASTRSDPDYPEGLLQLRYAVRITRYHPIAPDTDPQLAGSHPAYRRWMSDIERAPALLDFGPHGHAQAADASRAAREILRIPVDRPAPDGYRDHGDPDQADARTLARADGGAI